MSVRGRQANRLEKMAITWGWDIVTGPGTNILLISMIVSLILSFVLLAYVIYINREENRNHDRLTTGRLIQEEAVPMRERSKKDVIDYISETLGLNSF